MYMYVCIYVCEFFFLKEEEEKSGWRRKGAGEELKIRRELAVGGQGFFSFLFPPQRTLGDTLERFTLALLLLSIFLETGRQREQCLLHGLTRL